MAQCARAAKVVHAAYRQVLERDIQPALLAHQAALLSNHVNNVRQLVESLVSSAEYTERFVQGKSAEDVLRGYYRHIFARDSDAKGLAFNASLLRTAGHAKVAIAFEESLEYRQRFGEWIVPGAPPRIKYCGK
jgi:phycobilisome core-membrane linker protein